MTRLTDEQITQKAQAVMYAQPSAPLLGHYRAAIIATLTEYAPHLLPRDPLKPCPFCGEAGQVEQQGGGPMSSSLDWFCVRCPECDAHTDGGRTEAEAIAAWNRRTPESGK
jgi:Lar family restriction alleviation protein